MTHFLEMTPHDQSIIQDLGFQFYFANRWVVIRLLDGVEHSNAPPGSELFKPENWTGVHWSWFFDQFEVKVVL